MEIEVNSTSPQFTAEIETASVLDTQSQIAVARLQDLADFESQTANDKYVLVYDSSSQKYKMVNPDEVLNYAAGTETTQPGLVGYASTFLDRMDIDLDDRINLDAGTF
jgi:hypothetical protein